MIFRAWF